MIKEIIKNLDRIPLIDSKEFKNRKSLKNREIYWSFRNKVYTFDYLCPKTNRIWLTDNKSGYNDHQNTNALSEMYLINIKN